MKRGSDVEIFFFFFFFLGGKDEGGGHICMWRDWPPTEWV